jgi:hypothetical protein
MKRPDVRLFPVVDMPLADRKPTFLVGGATGVVPIRKTARPIGATF